MIGLVQKISIFGNILDICSSWCVYDSELLYLFWYDSFWIEKGPEKKESQTKSISSVSLLISVKTVDPLGRKEIMSDNESNNPPNEEVDEDISDTDDDSDRQEEQLVPGRQRRIIINSEDELGDDEAFPNKEKKKKKEEGSGDSSDSDDDEDHFLCK